MSTPTGTGHSATDPTAAAAPQGPELEAVLAGAEAARRPWGRTGAAERATALRHVADALDAAAATLIPIAHAESHLPVARLTGELGRTTFQLRLHADEIGSGRPFEARIDHADPTWGMGPRPDLRRIQVPLGPVVVFAASNFPFAFSVAGGDTSAALAAGCPVILKAHPGHPRLSDATGAVVRQALLEAGAPDGVFAVIHSEAAGRAALLDPRVSAGAFTGSIAGGRALFDLAVARPVPIPFFGELGSSNPVFVTRAAAAHRADEIATGFLGSFTLGAGQFCTKPGLLLVPAESPLVAAVVDRVGAGAVAPQPMLNERIEAGYRRGLSRTAAHADVQALASVPDGPDGEPGPTLHLTTVEALLADESLLDECFGPTALVVGYRDEADLLRVAERLPGQLTATLFAEPDDAVAAPLAELAVEHAGRVLWNQWPTGVSVTHAQQHGGPYPATTAPATTSVGTAAIGRFLRPVAYQGFPANLLPELLRDAAE